MEVCERFFQLLQLRCRTMYFDSCEIAHCEQFREQLANVVQMCENAFGVSVTFAAEKLIAIPAEFVQKHRLLRRGPCCELRQHRLDRIQFPGMHFEYGCRLTNFDSRLICESY